MGAHDRGDAPVEVPAHRHLLARHLGVEVDEHDLGAATLQLAELRVGRREGRAGDGELELAAQVQDPDARAADVDDRRSAAGIPLRVVGRAHEPLAAVDELVGVAMAVDVVAGGDHLDAGREDLVRGPLGDADAARRVLAVGDHEVGLELLAQAGEDVREPAAAGAADDVADEEDPHATTLDRNAPPGGPGGSRH